MKRLPVDDPKVAKRRESWRKRSAKYYSLNKELVIEKKRWRIEDRKAAAKQ